MEKQLHEEEGFKNWEKNHRNGRVCAGFLILFAAALFFCKESGYFIPEWVFTWPVLLIGIGIVSAVKHQFRHPIWIILIAIGTIFLVGDLIPYFSFDKYKIPLILLIIGLVMIFKPRNNHRKRYARYMHKHHHHWNAGSYGTMNSSSDDFIVLHNVFAGTKKNILSKDFKGGDIRNTFGGCELNLMLADFTGEAVITINQQFGGIKLIIPPNWMVKSDLACVFAGIEDDRPVVNTTDGSQAKILVLKGQIFMSGVEIVSY